MPDTGAPWNIPYVAGTDLVADWPTDNQTQAEAIAAALTSAAVIKQVVQSVKTDTFDSTSTSFTDITDMAVTITPSDNTNKVLVILNVNLGASADCQVKLLRDSTDIYIGDAAGNRTQATVAINGNEDGANTTVEATAVYLDSPATAAAVTYKAQMRVTSGTGRVNRSNGDTDSSNRPRTASSITVIEVAA